MSSAQIRTEEPLFAQKDGPSKLDLLRKELEIFVNILNASPPEIMSRTLITINTAALNPGVVGMKESQEILKWWQNPKTNTAVFEFIDKKNHQVDGTFGNWSCGFMGSRWCDVKLNGRNCRIAFYSKKYNPSAWEGQNDEDVKAASYMLTIDPTN